MGTGSYMQQLQNKAMCWVFITTLSTLGNPEGKNHIRYNYMVAASFPYSMFR